MNPFWLPSLEHINTITTDMTMTIMATCKTVPECCPRCGTVDKLYRHGPDWRAFRDVPSFPHHVIFRLKVQRWKCRECSVTFSQDLPDMDGHRQMTKRCVAYIQHHGVARTFSDIAREVGVDEKTVRQICTERFAAQMADWELWAPRLLGIDELMLGGEMRGIFVDLGGKRTIDLTPGVTRGQMGTWLWKLPDRHDVKVVTMDMTRAYRDAVAIAMPNAKIVMDKFHVLRYADDALRHVRARARRKANGGDGKNPHRNVSLLRMRGHRLNEEQEMALDGILANNPLVKVGYEAKEAFHNIWRAKGRRDAEVRYMQWKIGLPDEVRREFGAVARMVDRWHKEIFTYFEFPATNAFVENRNGLIKIANRAGRGYTFDVIRAKALLMKPLAKMALCQGCKAQLPAKTLRTLEIGMQDAMTLEMWVEPFVFGKVCGDCLHVAHTVIWPNLDGCFSEKSLSKSE